MKSDGLNLYPIFLQSLCPLPVASHELGTSICMPYGYSAMSAHVAVISLHNSHRHQSQTSYHRSHPAGLQIDGCRVDVFGTAQ